jgi:deoxyadenosine/deoxycytidine kinase
MEKMKNSNLQECCLSRGVQRCGFHICVLGVIGSGKCVSGDTIICADGIYRRIKEIIDKDGFTEKQLPVLSNFGNELTSHVFREKTDKVIQIKTNHGVNIKCTPEHPLLVLEGLTPSWKRSDEIVPGDVILGNGFKYIHPAGLDVVYYLKGVFCADGSREGEFADNKKESSAITVIDSELLRFKELLSSIGYEEDIDYQRFSRMQPNKYRLYSKKTKNHTVYQIAFGHITEFTKSKTFYEPMNENQLLSKLAGILDTDSYIKDCGIEIVQKREDIINDIINSLSMLGINGVLTKKYVKGFEHPFYRLYLSMDASKKLATLCLPYVQFTGEKLSSLINRQYVGRVRNNPDSSHAFVVDKNALRRVVCHKIDNKFSACVHQARLTGKVSMFLLKQMYERNQIIFNPEDYSYHVVTEVESLPFDDYVYDVTIPTTHAFLANGLISHNTTVSKALQHQIIHETGHCWGLYEPVEQNPILPLYYKDPKRYAFEMQVYMLNRRLEQQKLAQDLAKAGICSVQDSSLFGDSCFVEMLRKQGIMDDIDVQTYSELFLNMSDNVMYPTLVVYLDCEPETAKNRIIKRGRDCEKDIDLGYLSALKEELDILIDEFERYTSVFRINANIDLTEDEIVQEAIDIFNFAKETRKCPILNRMGV